MAKISKSERLLNMVSFLLKARRPVPLAEIKESVVGYDTEAMAAASVERRFERDKAALRELGIPVEFVGEDESGGPGYLIPHDAYFLPRIELTHAESAILAASGRLAMDGAVGPVSDALTSALRKLHFDSAIPGEVGQTAEEHFLFQTGSAKQDRSDDACLQTLSGAVLGHHAVRFTYAKLGRGKEEERTLDPYGIGFAEGHWYVVGFDRAREDIRTFRIDRIQKDIALLHPATTRPEFDVPDDFSVKDYVGVPPWLFGRVRRTAVRIRFDRDVAFMVRLRPAPGDKWEDEEDGHLLLTRKVTQVDAFLDWVLRFGQHAEVVDPPEVRERIVERLKALREVHASGRGAARG
jgi:predicted DNA-binding transcriptional regulator YafY